VQDDQPAVGQLVPGARARTWMPEPGTQHAGVQRDGMRGEALRGRQFRDDHLGTEVDAGQAGHGAAERRGEVGRR
jgi:hypothetical protein